MTRKEQIKEAARNETGKYPNACITYHAFVMGAEWADENPKWISIDDALPHYGDWVLMYIPSDKPQVYTGRVDFGETDHWKRYRNVTHWMPLPAPPKEGD